MTPVPDPAAPRLDAIRLRCREVSDAATWVRIIPDAIGPYARTLRPADPSGADPSTLPAEGADPWSVGPMTTHAASADPATSAAAAANDAADPEHVTALVLTLDSINFGSGYHDHVRKRPGCSGAVTMATAVRAWAEHEPITAARLLAVTPAEAHVLFDQPTDAAATVELMAHFATALNDLGRLVGDGFRGSFVALVEAADHSAERLVALLAGMPYFRDVSTYGGRPVPFYKRAQLAAADLDRAFAGQGLGAFADLDRLTAFADNLVPHVLRIDGVLTFDPALAADIEAGVPVPAGSPAEVEIRAAGVHAVELLRAELERDGLPVRSSDLDAVLWARGGAPRYKAVPRHRTRSVFY